jgi:DNA repair protein SbcD/Mre11
MTDPLRIIHVADCHLDAPSRSLARDVRERVEQSARASFERAVGLAIDRQADALVIAGDLFDRDLLRIATELWLGEALGEATAAGVNVIVVTGNHDPGGGGGPLDRIVWPQARFHLVRGPEPVRIPLPRPDGSLAGVVVAAGHASARERDNLVAGFPRRDDDVPVVGLVHCQVHGYEGPHDRYAPCTAADLDRAGYDYWALGHVHIGGRVAAETPAWYAGCLQGRHFGETGAKGALDVEIGPDGANVEFRPLAPVRWHEMICDDLAAVDGTRAMIEHCENRFDELTREHGVLPGQDWVLRLRLRGGTPFFAELRGAEAADDLALALRERLQLLDVEVRDDGVAPPIEVAEHEGQPHVLGVALDLIRQARHDEAALARLAPAQLAGAPEDEAGRAAYVRALLDGLDVDIAAAMLEERER